MFHCLPDELSARFDALGNDKGGDALLELLAYYQIQKENRQREEWERAVGLNHH